MNCTATRLPYRQTNAFSQIALDYIDQVKALQPFFQHSPSLAGIQEAIAARKQFPVRRGILVTALQKQYEGITVSTTTAANIKALGDANTFTITTAHQNNIFTGPLYFIYKIIHAIRLADELNKLFPENHFVPVYYIGSEDADLAELNHIWMEGIKYEWKTSQSGAVGRMLIDKDVSRMIHQLEGRLSVLPHGNEITDLIKKYYTEGQSIQAATFQFVNHLFSDYGLVVLLPDNAALKSEMRSIFEDDLLHQSAARIVEKTTASLEQAGYKVQANPRDINLFYLKDDIRERIEKQDDHFAVVNTSIRFSEEEMLKELSEHPERFSPNVILRGLYQETILPNIVFIGGGGETAYWLQLKELFGHYQVPFPVLVLRNSFLLTEEKWVQKINKLSFRTEDFFLSESELLNKLVLRETSNNLKLNGQMNEIADLYDSFTSQAGAIDTTLEKHVAALKTKTLQRLQELEKKMLRAEKRKFADQRRQIETVKQNLFPGNGLQERKESMLYYYAQYGPGILQALYDHSLALEQEFVILSVN